MEKTNEKGKNNFKIFKRENFEGVSATGRKNDLVPPHWQSLKEISSRCHHGEVSNKLKGGLAGRNPNSPFLPDGGANPKGCPHPASILQEWLKFFILDDFDRVSKRDFMPLTGDAYFVRDEFDSSTNKKNRGKTKNEGTRRESSKIISSTDLTTLLCGRLEKFFKSHSPKFRLGQASMVEGRKKRHDQGMLTMMMLGFMILMTVLVPTGFQFLTVLGGKSLLLAKMALIMSAIGGLKSITNSNPSYGVYYTGSTGHDRIRHGFRDKMYGVHSQRRPQDDFKYLIRK